METEMVYPYLVMWLERYRFLRSRIQLHRDANLITNINEGYLFMLNSLITNLYCGLGTISSNQRLGSTQVRGD